MCVHKFIYLIVYAICRYTYKKSHKHERERELEGGLERRKGREK